MTVDELIQRHEGLRAKPYADSVGKVTIGIGRNLSDIGLSPEEIQALYLNDKARAVSACNIYPWFSQLTAARKAACLDLAFNLGHLSGFPNFIGAMALHDYEAAANELVNSLWYKEVGVRGVELVQLIRNEVWPS